jgi:hypothetical protein
MERRDERIIGSSGHRAIGSFKTYSLLGLWVDGLMADFEPILPILLTASPGIVE